MRVHVTGSEGLLGREVASALQVWTQVHVSDVADMDIGNRDQVFDVLGAQRPEALVHLAAVKGNAPSRAWPLAFYEVNTTGTVHLLEACRELGIGQLVFVSSLSVHGPSEAPLVESSGLDPIHPYGGSKLAAEAMVRAYAHAYDIRSTILRPNFIVGPIQPPRPYADNLIYDFIQMVLDGGVIELAGEGQYEREWLHPRDVASAVELALQRPPAVACRTFLLTGNRVTMRGLAQRIIARVGTGQILTNPKRGGFSMVGDSTAAEHDLGWTPRTTLDQIIEEIWDEFQVRHAVGRHFGH